MSEQEDFVHRIESRLREWQDKIDDLEKKMSTAGPEGREELSRRIEEYRHNILDTRKKLQEYRDHAGGAAQDREAEDHAEDVLKNILSEP
jgi:predicted  nucleic acid-binding Zn-ribbon protein